MWVVIVSGVTVWDMLNKRSASVRELERKLGFVIRILNHTHVCTNIHPNHMEETLTLHYPGKIPKYHFLTWGEPHKIIF